MSIVSLTHWVARALYGEQRAIYISKLAGHNYDFVLQSLGPGTPRKLLIEGLTKNDKLFRLSSHFSSFFAV